MSEAWIKISDKQGPELHADQSLETVVDAFELCENERTST